MNLATKLLLIFFTNIFLFSNGLSMYGLNEPKKEKRKPYIIKLDKEFKELSAEKEIELGLEYEKTYMKESDYKKDNEKKSYSSYSGEYGESKFASGEEYYKGVTDILDTHYDSIQKSVGSEFDYIRVHAGWHSNAHDEEHITLSFVKNTVDGMIEPKKIRLHLDKTGIKEKKK